jgi:hypothetical protein
MAVLGNGAFAKIPSWAARIAQGPKLSNLNRVRGRFVNDDTCRQENPENDDIFREKDDI